MDFGTYLQFIIALLIVIMLIAALAYGAKKLGLTARVTINSPLADTRRLNVVEILNIDTKRRLMIIRRDDTEHLIMTGAEKDLVIEQNIDPKTIKTIKKS